MAADFDTLSLFRHAIIISPLFSFSMHDTDIRLQIAGYSSVFIDFPSTFSLPFGFHYFQTRRRLLPARHFRPRCLLAVVAMPPFILPVSAFRRAETRFVLSPVFRLIFSPDIFHQFDAIDA
jgi:hypothetical protein